MLDKQAGLETVCHFFSIPPELRNGIYRFCDGPVEIRKSYLDTKYMESPARITGNGHLSILLVSKQFKEEYEAELGRSKAALHVKISRHASTSNDLWTHPDLCSMLQSVRNIHLDIKDYTGREREGITSLLEELRALEMVEIVFDKGTHDLEVLHARHLTSLAQDLFLYSFDFANGQAKYQVKLAMIVRCQFFSKWLSDPLHLVLDELWKRSCLSRNIKYRVTLSDAPDAYHGLEFEVKEDWRGGDFAALTASFVADLEAMRGSENRDTLRALLRGRSIVATNQLVDVLEEWFAATSGFKASHS